MPHVVPTVPSARETAPDFTLLTDAGQPLTLSAQRGRAVVLFFHPKDGTTGCTTEVCEFRDLFPRFDDSRALVLGVSPDPVRSHAKFRAKHELPFTLLADVEHAVADAYGVWREKSMYGRKYMGVERTTFIIDRHGRIAHLFAKVKPGPVTPRSSLTLWLRSAEVRRTATTATRAGTLPASGAAGCHDAAPCGGPYHE